MTLEKDLMNSLLKEKTSSCTKCGNKREIVNEEALPAEMKAKFHELGDMVKNIDYYLYCPNCNEHSIIFKSEFGF